MNAEFKQSYEMTVADPSAIAAAESVKARIQAAYIMAINRPRNADDARVRILEACRRPEFAARVEFNKPVGKGIKGPTIRFAETAMRLWGNIDSDVQVVYDDEQFRRISIRVTDLETNSTFSKQINIRKTVERKNAAGRDGVVIGQRQNSNGEIVYIVQSTDDELITKENALISKAIRNEGLRLIPSDIIDEGLAVARETLRTKDSQDPAAAKKRILDAFAGLGVKPKELEKYLKHGLDTISPAEIGDLRAVHAAIKEGDATWADYIKTDEPAEPVKPVTFQDDPKTTAADAKVHTARNPRSDKGTKRAAEEPFQTTTEGTQGPQDEDIPNTMHPDSDDPMATELDRLRAELRLHSSAHKDVVKHAMSDTGIAAPQSIDGYRVLLDKIEELLPADKMK
jgi:hypothetical protein